MITHCYSKLQSYEYLHEPRSHYRDNIVLCLIHCSKHIPSALFFDLNKCVKPQSTLARNPPEPACFTSYAQSLGINNDSHVIVCDRGGMVGAARTWWTFRVGHQLSSVSLVLLH